MQQYGWLCYCVAVHTTAWDTDNRKQQDIITKPNIQNQEQTTARDVDPYSCILLFYYFDTNFNEFFKILYSVFSYTF
jgi:hypothetical protein